MKDPSSGENVLVEKIQLAEDHFIDDADDFPVEPPKLNGSYNCIVCLKVFLKKRYLDQHSRVHNGVKTYTFDICQKSFAAKQSLGFHAAIHTGEKPFKCDCCDKSFTRASFLERHKDIHCGDNIIHQRK
jgi:uncharacterized Zn-finger protein